MHDAQVISRFKRRDAGDCRFEDVLSFVRLVGIQTEDLAEIGLAHTPQFEPIGLGGAVCFLVWIDCLTKSLEPHAAHEAARRGDVARVGLARTEIQESLAHHSFLAHRPERAVNRPTMAMPAAKKRRPVDTTTERDAASNRKAEQTAGNFAPVGRLQRTPPLDFLFLERQRLVVEGAVDSGILRLAARGRHQFRGLSPRLHRPVASVAFLQPVPLARLGRRRAEVEPGFRFRVETVGSAAGVLLQQAFLSAKPKLSPQGACNLARGSGGTLYFFRNQGCNSWHEFP
jgi:hypothetical protein